MRTIRFIQGLLVGVGLMYFLDPEHGPRRQRDVSDSIHRLTGEVKGKLKQAAESLPEAVEEQVASVRKRKASLPKS